MYLQRWFCWKWASLSRLRPSFAISSLSDSQLTEILDIDECGLMIHDCENGTICRNTIGSFRCSCPPGYQITKSNCTDVDECNVSRLNLCHPELAVCSNTVGSYSCTCKHGYSGDGQYCFRTYTCQTNRAK